MPETVEDQCTDNKQNPNVPVTAEGMRKLGISYWKMDADSFKYPVKEVPWDPKDAQDPKLKALRDDRGYSYADIITVHPDHLPGFEDKIKSFFEGKSIVSVLLFVDSHSGNSLSFFFSGKKSLRRQCDNAQ